MTDSITEAARMACGAPHDLRDSPTQPLKGWSFGCCCAATEREMRKLVEPLEARIAELKAIGDEYVALTDRDLDLFKRRAEEAEARQVRMFPIQSERGANPHPTRIPWSVADKAYSVYSARYGRDQTLERMAERGGFGPSEMDLLLPGWREECSLAAERDAAVRRAEEAERALVSLTPGGSEFAGDTARCAEYVRERLDEMHEAKKDRVLLRRERDRLSAEVAAMREVVKIVDGSYQWLQIRGAETLVLALDRYRALKREEAKSE